MQEKTLRAFDLDEDVDDIVGDTFIQRSHIRDPWEAACLANREERASAKEVCREREREEGSERGSTAIVALVFQAPGDLGCSQVKQSP